MRRIFFKASSQSMGTHISGCIASTLIVALIVSTAPSRALSQISSCTPRQYQFVVLKAPFPGVDQTLARGINDLGDVVGQYHDATGPHGFLLHNGKYSQLPQPLTNATNVDALAINIFGDITGVYDEGGITHGFLLTKTGFSKIDFPGPNVYATFPNGINALGQIAGSYDDNVGSHAFLLDQGKFTSFVVPTAAACGSAALGINDRTEIVGEFTCSDGQVHGYARAANGTVKTMDLPGLETLPTAISNAEEIGAIGFIYFNGVVTRLTDLNPNLIGGAVGGVNDLGELSGTYNAGPGGQEGGFLLIPK